MAWRHITIHTMNQDEPIDLRTVIEFVTVLLCFIGCLFLILYCDARSEQLQIKREHAFMRWCVPIHTQEYCDELYYWRKHS